MIPLLVPIGLGLIGGYLTKESDHEMFAKGGSIEIAKEDIEIVGVPRSEINEKEWASILRMAKYQDRGTFILKDEKGLDVVPQVEYEWYVKEKYAEGGEIDMDEVEKSAQFYADESRWSEKPTIEKFEEKIREKEELKRQLDNKEIRPSDVIGKGYKSQYARKIAYRWLNEQIAISKRAIEILKEKGKYAKGGGVGDNEMPDEIIGNDNIKYIKAKTHKNPNGEIVTKYEGYWNGHSVDGFWVGSINELKRYIENRILSTNQYNRLKNLPIKELPKYAKGGKIKGDYGKLTYSHP